MIKLSIIVMLSCAISTAAQCVGPSQSAVQTAINGTAAGGTVTVCAGTASWSPGITISGISLIGAGSSTSGTVITAGAVTINKHATQLTRLSGFRFSGNDVHGNVNGATSARAYIIDNNYFFSDGSNVFFNFLINGGLLHHNTFFSPTTGAPGPDALLVHPNEDWSQATTMGNADTQGPLGGERNIYFENNTFTNLLESSPDGDQGARLVIRHNQYNDSSLVFHAGAQQIPINDTSSFGARQFEIYNNTFSRVDGINNDVNKWIWVRGGSGVIANNTMDNPSSGFWGTKASILIGVGCNGNGAASGSWNGTWPINHEIGQTNDTPTTPTQPLLIFNNTGAGGSTYSNFLSLGGNDTGPGPLQYTTCSIPGTYVQTNRDYYLSNQWNWTPFTFPHPLATGVSVPLGVSGSGTITGSGVVHN